MKSRWSCLDKSEGILLYTPEKVCHTIWACAVLHNIDQRNGIPAPAPILPDKMDAHTENEEHAPREVVLGEHVMQRLLMTGKTHYILLYTFTMHKCQIILISRTSAVHLPMASIVSFCDCSTTSIRTRAEVTEPQTEPGGVERSLEPGRDWGTLVRPGAVALDPL